MKRFHAVPYSLLLCMLSPMAVGAQTNTPSRAKATAGKPIKLAEKPIPTFSVWQLRTGGVTESQVSQVQLNPTGYWLMLYVDIKSKACQDLLTQLQTMAAPTVSATGEKSPARLDPAKIVIVASRASGAQLSQFQLNYPGLAAATWTHDTQSAAANALGLRGTPHFFGMHENAQRWQYAGTPAPAVLPSMLTTWVAMNAQPKNKLDRKKSTPPAATNSAAKNPPTPALAVGSTPAATSGVPR